MDCCQWEECCCLSIMLLLLITPIYFYFFINPKYDFENNLVVQEIKSNLNGKLIYSLRQSFTCESDEEVLILGKWDGITNGCDCEGSIEINKCSEEKIEHGCKTIFSVKPMFYTYFNSKYFCAKTSKLNYKELLLSDQVVSKYENCPYNYKSCGVIDTFERKFCVRKEESCPLNINNFTKITGNDNEEVRLLTIIKLGQEIPCINISEKFWDYYYELEHESQKCSQMKGKLYDDRYIKFNDFKTNKLQLYNDNSITNKLKDINENSLNKMKNDIIYLYGRNFLGFDNNNSFNYDELLNKQNNINTSFKAIFYICLGGIILFFVFIFLRCGCIKNIKITVKVLELECEKNGLGSFLEIITLSFFIFIPIIDFIVFFIIYKNNKNIHSILTFKEIDEFAIDILENFKKKDLIGNGYYLFMMMVFPIFLLIIICLICQSYNRHSNTDYSRIQETKIENLIENSKNKKKKFMY